MIDKHDGREERVHTFGQVWERLNTAGRQQLTTRAGAPFVARAATIGRGKGAYKRAILYSQNGQDYGRCYECCWEHYSSCNGTRIGEYSRAIDAWTGSPVGIARIARDELLELIEQNGGPGGLDLAGRDLGRLDLGTHSLAQELEKRGLANTDHLPTWVHWDPVTQTRMGVDLQHALLKGARLAYANLQGARLECADLEGANLYHANLQDANIIGANLRQARLEGADLQRASLMEANLQEASLVRANLQQVGLMWANLRGARLEGANLKEVDLLDARDLQGARLFRARLERTNLTRNQLGEAIGEETNRAYREAKEAYLALKNNFETIGRYDDASWAYVKERKMEKMINHPRVVRRLTGVEEGISYRTSMRSAKWWGFYSRHTLKWLGDWLVELVCGYGESFRRVLATLALVYVLFTLGYGVTWSVMRVTSGPEGLTRTFSASPVDWAIFSLGALTTMDPAGLEARNNLVQLFAGLEALLGIFLTGLLGFVVANRIRRS